MKIAEVKGLSTKELKEKVDAEAASLILQKSNNYAGRLPA